MTTARLIKARNRLCSGCELCLLTCSLVRTGTVNPRLARLRLAHDEDEAARPVICVHCKDALCLKACQVPGAMEVDPETGAIVVDDEKCTRCLDCIEACPFDAIWIGPDGEILKCDLCGGEPQCVKYCPPRPAHVPPQPTSSEQSCLQYVERRKKGKDPSE